MNEGLLRVLFPCFGEVRTFEIFLFRVSILDRDQLCRGSRFLLRSYRVDSGAD